MKKLIGFKDLPFVAPNTTDDYRDELTHGVLRIGIILGSLILLPIVIVSALGHGNTVLAIVDCLAFIILLVLRFYPSLPPIPVQAVIVSTLFIIGSIHYQDLSLLPSGIVLLCSASSLSSIFFGLKGGMFVCLAQALLMAGIGLAHKLGPIEEDAQTLSYVVSSIEALGFSILFGIVQGYVLKGMRRSIAARGKLASELTAREADLIRETASRSMAERRASFLESHDSLTRLPNRENFEFALARAIKAASGRGRTLGVMTIGIDRFNRVCETHGPAASDAILIEASNRLARNFRDDDLIARAGGDIFHVLLADIKTPDDANSIIEKSRLAFDRSFSIGGSEIGLSASFGLAFYPNDGEGADSLIRASDVALHLAKENGPGSYRLYDAELHSRLIAKSLIEEELRGALRLGAFIPWYQPKVDVSGRIIGAEALARWLLPEGRFRQPLDFIQTAENSGAIAELGRMVLAKACAAAASWERAGLDPIPISVNLSPYQFRRDDLVKDVRSILHATQLPASRLDLEITESGIMEDGVDAIEKLAELKSLGCSISIDDFGTGYSSFAALRDYPVDCVKLPQSFISPLPMDPRATTITSAVIDLAHRLDFSVVAEGVENIAQFSWLGAARCDQYQGFLFSRPMPEPNFEDALARRHCAAVE